MIKWVENYFPIIEGFMWNYNLFLVFFFQRNVDKTITGTHDKEFLYDIFLEEPLRFNCNDHISNLQKFCSFFSMTDPFSHIFDWHIFYNTLILWYSIFILLSEVLRNTILLFLMSVDSHIRLLLCGFGKQKQRKNSQEVMIQV